MCTFILNDPVFSLNVVTYFVLSKQLWILYDKVGIPNFVSGPREYIMEGEYLILAMCSWFRIS